MDKPKLLIADGTEEFCCGLADLLRGSYEVYCCSDGNEARQLLRKTQPDILVLDLMLPGYDGVSLLHWAAQEGIRPVVLALSLMTNGYVTKTVTDLGVAFLMRKPCNLGATAARVLDLTRDMAQCRMHYKDQSARVADMLQMLGIPAKLRGYEYLKEAVPLMAEDPGQPITKALYPEVARRCSCASTHVERSIRSAIFSAWARRDDNIWRLYFYPNAQGAVVRPTNGEFISRLAECLRRRNQQEDQQILQQKVL